MLNYLRNIANHLIISLRFSLLTIFTFLFISTAIIFISLFYMHVNEIVERAALLLMDEASSLTLEELNNDFKPIITASLFTDELMNDEILHAHDNEQMAGYLTDVLKEYPLTERTHWFDSDGDLVYAWREPDNTTTTEIIKPNASPATDEFFYHNATGQVVKHVVMKPSQTFHGSQGYYAALKLKRSVWTNVFRYTHPPHYTGIALATPIFQSNGRPWGVLEFDLRLNELSQNLANHKISSNGKVMIINQSGQVIAAPELSVPSTEVKEMEKLELKEITSFNPPWIGEAFKLYQRNKQNTFSFIFNNVRYFATFKPIPIFSDDKWLISIVVPATDFSKRVHEVEYFYIFIFLCIFIIGLILISTLVSRVVNPIKSLVAETQRIRLFELEGSTRVISQIKEVIDLSDSIYAMKMGLRSFQKYVPAGLVRQLMLAGEDAHIGGMKKELAIFFSDIKDFTQITENTDSDQLLKQIYDYFEALAPIVTQNHGTIDKYIGDSMMAFWGAPLTVGDPCHLAAHSALQCKSIIKTLNKRWETENKPLFETRIGIHFGNTIVGNVGSADRLNYTALGSVVNVTNRLVNANKIYGTHILVSESVYQQIKKDYILRFVDNVILKGAVSTMSTYELLAHGGDTLYFDFAAYTRYFQEAYNTYQKGAWQEAIVLFEQCLAVFPQDTLAPVFISRCHNFIAHPPKNWNGVWQMTEK